MEVRRVVFRSMAGKAGKRTGSAISSGRREMFGIAFLIAVSAGAEPAAEITGEAELFAPGIASTDYSEIRLTISPDGKTALWFSRDRSEEHTSELQSLMRNSYAVFCLKKKKNNITNKQNRINRQTRIKRQK